MLAAERQREDAVAALTEERLRGEAANAEAVGLLEELSQKLKEETAPGPLTPTSTPA